jgi:hypothetical protein
MDGFIRFLGERSGVLERRQGRFEEEGSWGEGGQGLHAWTPV